MKHNGVKSRIRPENSGLPCSSIQLILMVLSNEAGVTPLYSGNGEPSWVCREYPKAALPREVRCHEGTLHFEGRGFPSGSRGLSDSAVLLTRTAPPATVRADGTAGGDAVFDRSER